MEPAASRPEQRDLLAPLGSVLIAMPLWPVLRRVQPFLSAEGYGVEETPSWSRLLDAGLSCAELAGIFLGEHGSADEEVELVRRFRMREGAAGVPLILVGGMNAMMRASRFRTAGVDMVVPADTSPEAIIEKAAPLLHYGTLYRSVRDVNRSLREQAMLDELTGLPNRRRFSLDAARHVEMARRIGRPLSCILIDVDDFKQVNELHGQAAGDAVIRQVGAMLEGGKRAYDSVARIGGDEFAWLLVDADREKAMQAAERARGMLKSFVFELPGGPVRLTATFGVATAHPGVDLSVERLVGNADRALYWGKESGKDAVRFYPAKRANGLVAADTYLS